jgi:hypothetical protein
MSFTCFISRADGTHCFAIAFLVSSPAVSAYRGIMNRALAWMPDGMRTIVLEVLDIEPEQPQMPRYAQAELFGVMTAVDLSVRCFRYLL